MRIGSERWLDLLRDGAAKLGVAVSHDQAIQFAQHGLLLMAWNRKINLTAITDPTAVAVKHFLDAIGPLRYIPTEGRLLDIGTGGGFPGIPLKIMRPDQPMTLIDSVRKKINFVKHVIRQLSLQDIEALHIRAEALLEDLSGRDKYSVVVCRAIADQDDAVRLAAPLLIPNGKIILYQGPPRRVERHHQFVNGSTIDGTAYRLDTVSFALPVFSHTRSVTILEFNK